MEHLSTAELEAGLDDVRKSPSDGGKVELIVRRPAVDEPEVLAEGTLGADAGLAGDTWQVRGSTRTTAARFGTDAWRFVNSRAGRELRLRGLNTRVVVAGTVRPGDVIPKLPPDLVP